MKAHHGFFYKLFNLSLLFTIICGNFSAFAQSKTVSSNQSKQTAQKCSGAWTGTILYTRQQAMTSNKTVPRVSTRGEDKTDWEMKYDYKAQISVVESPEGNGQSRGIARVSHNFSSVEKVSATEKNSCDQGKTWQDMKGDSICGIL